MKKKSNQRITKIKKDKIEELLKQAEKIDPKNGTTIQEPGAELTPYPDFNYLRIWSRDYILKGLDKILINNISTDGQTYMTTLVDGLPLFTKLSKTYYRNYIQEAGVNPNYSMINITPNDAGVFQVSSGISGYQWAKLNNPDLSKLTPGTKVVLTFDHQVRSQAGQQRLFYGGDRNFLEIYIWDSVVLFNINGSEQTCSYPQSTIGNSRYELNTIFTIELQLNTNQQLYKLYNAEGELLCTKEFKCTSTVTPSSTTTFGFGYSGNTDCPCHIYGAKTYIEYPDGTRDYIWKDDIHEDYETTKPGLWLSNLIQPRSATTAGSWLCHNLINTNELDSPNLDTLGNYSYSFLQRGVYHRTSGSTHYNHDSYAQHWSPSYLSCISHDSLIIPFNNLRRTYTPYQTLVFPVDPDMQEYEETSSKDIVYQFVDNNDQTQPTITDFNGRIVGDGWSYEFYFEPNGDGSGNNYGEGGGSSSGPEGENGSNGGCVTGTIIYPGSSYDSFGSSCIQEVNACFQTIQSKFNPDVPDLSKYKLLDQGDEIPTPIEIDGSINRCCNWRPYNISPLSLSGLYYCNLSVSPYSDSGYTFDHWNAETESGETIEFTSTPSEPVYFNNYYGSATCGTYITYPRAIPEPSGYCGGGAAHVTGYVTKYNPKLDQKGVNIYMIITDHKCQYESQGLPWEYGCNDVQRFSWIFSTEKSTNKCDKNILIATNIDINKLGDISKLNSGSFKG